MSDSSFTDDEKRIISRILHREPRKIEGIFAYVAYILPSVLFAVYGIWNRDFVAVLVAYFALLVVALMYLSYTRNDAYVLFSAIKKYEEKVSVFQGRKKK